MNTSVNGSSVAYSEQEWELQEASHYSQSEMEGEWESQSEYFLGRTLQGIQKVARAAAPFAKQLAPIAAKTLIGTTPNSVAGNLLKSLHPASHYCQSASCSPGGSPNYFRSGITSDGRPCITGFW